jgi:hypothetical protein
MRSNCVYRILSYAFLYNQNLILLIYARHLQPDGGRPCGTLSTAELRTESEKLHLSVSRVQHRTQALTIHQGTMTNTVKAFMTVLGLPSLLSLTFGQSE